MYLCSVAEGAGKISIERFSNERIYQNQDVFTSQSLPYVKTLFPRAEDGDYWQEEHPPGEESGDGVYNPVTAF